MKRLIERAINRPQIKSSDPQSVIYEDDVAVVTVVKPENNKVNARMLQRHNVIISVDKF